MTDSISSNVIIFGIISMIAWGLSDIFASHSSRKIGYILNLLLAYIANLLVVLIIIILGNHRIILDLKSLVFSCIASFLYLAGSISYFKGFTKGKVSILATIASPWSIIVLIFGVLFLQENLSLIQILLIILIIVGTILMSIDLNELKYSTFFKISDPSVKYGLFALISWGIGFLLLNTAVRVTGIFIPNMILSMVGTISLLAFLLFSTENKRKLNNASIRYLSLGFLTGIFGMIGFLSYSAGVENMQSSLVSALAAASPLVTVLLSHVLFKERLTNWQYFGTLLILISVILLSL